MRQKSSNDKLSDESIFQNQYYYIKEIEWYHDFGELTIHSLAGIKYRKATGKYSATMSREDLLKSLIDNNNYAVLLRALSYREIGFPKVILPADWSGLSFKYSNLLRLVKSITDKSSLSKQGLDNKQTPGAMPEISGLDNFEKCVMQFYTDTDFFTAQGKHPRSAALRLLLDSRQWVSEVFFCIIKQKKPSIKYIEYLYNEIRKYRGSYNSLIIDEFLIRLEDLGYESDQLNDLASLYGVYNVRNDALDIFMGHVNSNNFYEAQKLVDFLSGKIVRNDRIYFDLLLVPGIDYSLVGSICRRLSDQRMKLLWNLNAYRLFDAMKVFVDDPVYNIHGMDMRIYLVCNIIHSNYGSLCEKFHKAYAEFILYTIQNTMVDLNRQIYPAKYFLKGSEIKTVIYLLDFIKRDLSFITSKQFSSLRDLIDLGSLPVNLQEIMVRLESQLGAKQSSAPSRLDAGLFAGSPPEAMCLVSAKGAKINYF